MTGSVPRKEWMDVPAVFKLGNYAYPAKKEKVEYLNSQDGLNFPNAREWTPEDEDWKLQETWKEDFLNGLKERLDKFRSLKIFMDCCVRCGACADKCHFFLGTGDPKNMPVLRAELLRSVYRGELTTAGKVLGKIVGGRELTPEVIKELFMYSYQCTECRRCSVFCPYGIDTAEITMMVRELLHLVGVGIN
ncbi:MAG: (Fe-S)-binding protein, partial [Desulfobulbaceae bacterium]|nr:(Fe-S)-binding protein [Desulfobulbaceae bacterium]